MFNRLRTMFHQISNGSAYLNQKKENKESLLLYQNKSQKNKLKQNLNQILRKVMMKNLSKEVALFLMCLFKKMINNNNLQKKINKAEDLVKMFQVLVQSKQENICYVIYIQQQFRNYIKQLQFYYTSQINNYQQSQKEDFKKFTKEKKELSYFSIERNNQNFRNFLKQTSTKAERQQALQDIDNDYRDFDDLDQLADEETNIAIFNITPHLSKRRFQ